MSRSLAWEPLSDDVGALITMHMLPPYTEQEADDLRRLYDSRDLLLFRGHEWSQGEQIEFVKLLGGIVEAQAHVSNRIAGFAMGGELVMHCDLAFSSVPLHGICLYGEEVSNDVASTRFVSNRTALRNLSQSQRDKFASAQVAHRYQEDQTEEGGITAWHPAIMQLPRTGEEVLFLPQMSANSIEGMPQDEAAQLIAEAQSTVLKGQGGYQHRWQPNDLLVWNNIALQHGRGAVETVVQKRHLRRVTFGKSESYTGLSEHYRVSHNYESRAAIPSS
jgi:taurine dioxygenase